MSFVNHYPGVNPHLNSALQSPGGDWEVFHARFIEKLTDELDLKLPAGYYAKNEKSLQIRALDPLTDAPLPVRPQSTIPDVMVYREKTRQPAQSSALPGMDFTLTFPVDTGFELEEAFHSAVIYQADDDNLHARPVTRIEILSPANKPGGSHYGQYLRKRQESLTAGLRLVEVDLLHESRPILSLLPDYTQGTAGAYPYMILVSDPRPGIHEGKTGMVGIRLQEVLKTIAVPLEKLETVQVDFNQVYSETCQNRRLFEQLTDYRREPERIETYSEADRVFIRQRMQDIARNT